MLARRLPAYCNARNSCPVQHMISTIFRCSDRIQKYLFPTLASLCMRPSLPVLDIPGHQGPNVNPSLRLYTSVSLSFIPLALSLHLFITLVPSSLYLNLVRKSLRLHPPSPILEFFIPAVMSLCSTMSPSQLLHLNVYILALTCPCPEEIVLCTVPDMNLAQKLTVANTSVFAIITQKSTKSVHQKHKCGPSTT